MRLIWRARTSKGLTSVQSHCIADAMSHACANELLTGSPCSLRAHLQLQLNEHADVTYHKPRSGNTVSVRGVTPPLTRRPCGIVRILRRPSLHASREGRSASEASAQQFSVLRVDDLMATLLSRMRSSRVRRTRRHGSSSHSEASRDQHASKQYLTDRRQ